MEDKNNKNKNIIIQNDVDNNIEIIEKNPFIMQNYKPNIIDNLLSQIKNRDKIQNYISDLLEMELKYKKKELELSKDTKFKESRARKVNEYSLIVEDINKSTNEKLQSLINEAIKDKHNIIMTIIDTLANAKEKALTYKDKNKSVYESMLKSIENDEAKVFEIIDKITENLMHRYMELIENNTKKGKVGIIENEN